MPSFKLTGAKSQEVKSGFEAYDGPTPSRKGFYRAVLKKITWGLNPKSGSRGFSIVAELEAANGDPKGHAQFDGFPMFSQSIITETKDGTPLKEGSVNNLSNLLAALGVKDEPDVVLAKGDSDEKKVDVLKIGGKNPVGTVINIDMGFEPYEGETRPSVNGIYLFKEEGATSTRKSGGKAAALEPDEDEEAEDAEVDENEEAEEGDFEEREAELNGLGVAELRRILKEDYDLDSKGPKAALVDRILDHEYPDDEEPEGDDEPEDEDEPEDDEPEDEDEGDEEDDEPEDDEDDEARAEREEELSGFNRAALKAVLKEIAPDFTVLKRHSDDDLRDQILSVEFASDETPF